MTTQASQFLIDCLMASGAPRDQAERAAEVVMRVCVASEMIPAAHLEAWELAARCYLLRRGSSIEQVSARLSIGRRWVIVQTGRHGRRVRAAYKAINAA